MRLQHRSGLWSVLACVVSALLAGCPSSVSVLGTVDDGGGTPPVGAPASLRLEGVSSALPLDQGASVELHAFAKYKDGSEVEVTGQASFTSSQEAVAAVAGSTLKAVGKGTCEIRASLASDAGAPLTDAVVITVQNPGADVTVAVEVAPAQVTLTPGLGAQLRANATQADGSQKTVTDLATWTSRNPSVCTIDDAVRKGLVTAVAAGDCAVDASYGGKSATAQVTVGTLTVTALSIAPSPLLIPKGATGQLIATATLSDGSAVDATRTATWSSDDPGTATVAAGLVTGVAAGSTSVSASAGGQTAKVAVKIDAAPLVAVSINPPQAVLSAGLSQQLRAVAVYGDGVSQDITAQAVWSVDQSAVATVATGTADAGLVQALAVGRAIVKATYAGQAGTAVITVSGALLVSLQVVPNTIALAAGTNQRLRAIGTFSDHSVRDVSTGVAWAVADPAVATVDGTGNLAALAKGTTKVTATLGAQVGAAAVTVTDATLVKILLLPVSVVVPIGLTQRLLATGIYSDNTLHDVTEQATWASASDAVASVSNSAGQRGTVAGVAAGDTTVTAALGAVTSQPASVTVSGAALLSVALQPRQLLLPLFLTVPLRLLANYSDGSQFDQTSAGSYSVDTPAVASIVASGPGAGQVTGLSQGRAALTGSFGGKSDIARLNVVAAILQSIQIQLPRQSLKVGDTEEARCLAQYQGAPRPIDVSPLCTFTSGDPSIARFLFQPPGTVTAQAPGDVQVFAELQGMSGANKLHVDPAVPVKITVQEPAFSLPLGVTRALIALATYADGSSADITLGCDWNSDANAVAVVGNGGLLKGLVTGVSGGTAHIIATQGAVAGQSTVTVVEAQPVSLLITPVNPVVTSPGGPFRPQNVVFYATAHYDDGTDQNVTESSSWTTSDPSVVTISDIPGRKGRATVLAPGGATVTATFKGLKSSTFLTAR